MNKYSLTSVLEIILLGRLLMNRPPSSLKEVLMIMGIKSKTTMYFK